MYGISGPDPSVPCCLQTMRGGQITFHGPGQLIAYPILDIRDFQVSIC